MKSKYLSGLIFLTFLVLSFPIFAEADQKSDISKGEVIEIVQETEEMDILKDNSLTIQHLKVKNTKSHEIVDVYNDFRPVSVGQKVFYVPNDSGGGEQQNILVGISRLTQIVLLSLLFIIVVAIFSGFKGIRSIFSLILSFLAIFYVMIPLILKGVNPLIVGPILALTILFFAIFLSYGFNRVSKIAFLGTGITVVITSILAFFAIKFFALSGITDETALYLGYFSEVSLNLVNLLTAGIIIGILGVLDDIAVTQVAVVRELYLSNSSLTVKEVYRRALRVGQDHVSALVNTLVLAYVGVALPLILILRLSNSGFQFNMSQEIIASEIVRTIVGSIGVVLAVPITTYLAAKFLGKDKDKLSKIHFHGGHSHDHHSHE